jgi:hypothetical protein
MRTIQTAPAHELLGETVTIRYTDAHGEQTKRSGLVTKGTTYYYLTVNRGTLREYSIMLGAANTPVHYTWEA